MTDRFYAVFVRLPNDGWGQRTTQSEAEEAARKYAEHNPQNEYFVMKTVSKYAAEKPEIIRTEIEHSGVTSGDGVNP